MCIRDSNTYDRIVVENMIRGIFISNVGSGNLVKNVQMVNVSDAFLVNSTASGTKTITLENISVAATEGIPILTFDLYDSISASEQYLINLPGDFNPLSLPNNRSIFNYHLLNYTIIAGTPSVDNFNFTWFDSELYNGDNEQTLESYYYNETSGLWQLMNNTPDTTNNKLGQNPLSIAGTYALFDFVNCPVITVAEPFEQQQPYYGAPNFIGGQFSCIYVNEMCIRDSCKALDGQTVKIDEDFSVKYVDESGKTRTWTGSSPTAHPNCECYLKFSKGGS